MLKYQFGGDLLEPFVKGWGIKILSHNLGHLSSSLLKTDDLKYHLKNLWIKHWYDGVVSDLPTN